jgi:hypothetical protein
VPAVLEPGEDAVFECGCERGCRSRQSGVGVAAESAGRREDAAQERGAPDPGATRVGEEVVAPVGGEVDAEEFGEERR